MATTAPDFIFSNNNPQPYSEHSADSESDCRKAYELTEIINKRLWSFRRIAIQVLGNDADAEDAVQDACLAAYRHLAQFKGESKISTWFTRIVINSARMRLRKRDRQRNISIESLDLDTTREPFSETLPDDRPNPETQYRKAELSRTLVRLSARLSPASRRVVEMCWVEGLTVQEAADFLGVKPNAVKSRLSRARSALRNLAQLETRHLPKGLSSGKGPRKILRSSREMATGRDGDGTLPFRRTADAGLRAQNSVLNTVTTLSTRPGA
jgi:RNA polymerase sigma factor (sigma-70 family)